MRRVLPRIPLRERKRLDTFNWLFRRRFKSVALVRYSRKRRRPTLVALERSQKMLWWGQLFDPSVPF